MLASEVADLLTFNGELDRFASIAQVSPERAVAWAAVINHSAPEMTPGEAQQLVIEFYAEAGESLTSHALVDLWRRKHRMLPDQIATDVRVAKARGLLERSWPEREPLPGDAREALRRAREGDQVAAAEIAARPAGGNALPQLVTKRVPA